MKNHHFFLGLLLSFVVVLVQAAEYEGFTEPNREIMIAAAEVDILEKVAVSEGSWVKKGQMVAILDNSVLHAALSVAKARKNSHAQLNAAKAIKKLRQDKLNRLLPLLQQGNAQQYEVTQARIEVESADAEVKAAQEALYIAKLEYKKIQAQIEKRTLRSPISGIVTEVRKDRAELVGGNDAHILTVANFNPLKIIIHVPTAEALKLKQGQNLDVKFPQVDFKATTAQIRKISPITDAGSDTVKIEMRLKNPKNRIRSGVKCIVSTPNHSQ